MRARNWQANGARCRLPPVGKCFGWNDFRCYRSLVGKALEIDLLTVHDGLKAASLVLKIGISVEAYDS